MKFVLIGVAILVALLLAVPVVFYFQTKLGNPKVARELVENPDGEKARKVMLLTLPSGREIPVNYLRENGRVYAGADGRWWKELEGDRVAVLLFIQGQHLEGRALAIRDAPAYTKDIFSRLRPTAVPGFGTLIEILLDPADPGGPR